MLYQRVRMRNSLSERLVDLIASHPAQTQEQTDVGRCFLLMVIFTDVSRAVDNAQSWITGMFHKHVGLDDPLILQRPFLREWMTKAMNDGLLECIERQGAGSAGGNRSGECFVFHSTTTVGDIEFADWESKEHCAASNSLVLSLRDAICWGTAGTKSVSEQYQELATSLWTLTVFFMLC